MYGDQTFPYQGLRKYLPYQIERMPNSFGSSNTNILTNIKPTTGYGVVGVFVVLAILVVVAYVYWPTGSKRDACPKELHRHEDGHLSLVGTGKTFSDMNEFQQWWHSSGDSRLCPLPLLTGARREQEILVSGGGDSGGGWPNEQTYAKTPIYKVDDYEFSRVVGFERGGHLVVPKENYNKILLERMLDWADLPLTAEARSVKYKGLQEGFTASGELDSASSRDSSGRFAPTGDHGVITSTMEATQRYGEKAHAHEYDQDVECKLSREAKEVAAMVAKAYENDPNFEPVITKVGANHWEVNELKPRRRHVEYSSPTDDRVVDTDNTRVHKDFVYDQDRVSRAAIDPFFPPVSDRYETEMDTMMGPSFDRANWSVPAGGPHPLMAP